MHKLPIIKLNPIMLKLETGLEESLSFNIEKLLIESMGHRHNGTGILVNISTGGDGGDIFTNNPRKEEIREMRRKQMAGTGNHRFGIKLEDTPSHKCKGKSHWNYGRKASKETLAKMSKNNSGSSNPNAKVIQKLNEKGDILEEFGTLKEAFMSVGSNKSCMWKACKFNKKLKGFNWKYK